MNITVYCSASADLPQEVNDIASALGKWIGENHHTLLYGGVKAGLMHTTAQAAQDAGCDNIIGIVPECFAHRADPLCTKVLLARDLSKRKSMLINRGDVFVVLPGGLGTIDEWISTLSQLIVDGKDKPIIVVNCDGMFSGMIQQLRATAQSQFARASSIDRSIVVDNTVQLINQLNKINKQ